MKKEMGDIQQILFITLAQEFENGNIFTDEAQAKVQKLHIELLAEQTETNKTETETETETETKNQ